MARSVGWRRECNDIVRRRIEEALQVTLYIVHQTGPTGFVVKEDGRAKKLKVFLGDPHSCSCAGFSKDKELCVHILWLLLKRYRVPQDNPILYQLALVEREVNELVHGCLRKKKAEKDTSTATGSLPSLLAAKKPVSVDDVCPICQEDLLGSPMALTHCRYGCGNSVHLKCMRIWADHQKSTGETTTRCPLCREDFGSLQDVSKDYQCAQKKTHHMHITCQNCGAHPIVGARYKCSSCSNYNLCEVCYASVSHCEQHQFRVRKSPSSKWSTIRREQSRPVTGALVGELQSRELTEDDYDLLLQLDRPAIISTAIDRLINSLPVEALDHGHPLLVTQCHICQHTYHRGDWTRTLPGCAHKFHRDCIDGWLRSGHSVCPVDGISIHARQQQRRRRRQSSSKKKEQLLTVHRRESLPQDFSLVGHSALNTASSLPAVEHTSHGRIQRGIVSQQQNGRHSRLPTILPQLAVEGQRDHYTCVATSRHNKVLQPVRKLSQQQHIPAVTASPDPSINITIVPLVSR